MTEPIPLKNKVLLVIIMLFFGTAFWLVVVPPFTGSITGFGIVELASIVEDPQAIMVTQNSTMAFAIAADHDVVKKIAFTGEVSGSAEAYALIGDTRMKIFDARNSSFTNMCVDTCSLNASISSYDVEFVVDGTLTISSVAYNLASYQEINESGTTQLQNVNITKKLKISEVDIKENIRDLAFDKEIKAAIIVTKYGDVVDAKSGIEVGEYDLDVFPLASQIVRLRFTNVLLDENFKLKVESINKTHYGFDASTLKYEKLVIDIQPINEVLYKCKKVYRRSCDSEYLLWQSVVPKKLNTFAIDDKAALFSELTLGTEIKALIGEGDGIGSFSDIIESDGLYYAVFPTRKIAVNGFDTRAIEDKNISKVELYVKYKVAEAYFGSEPIKVNDVATSIVPSNGEFEDTLRHTDITLLQDWDVSKLTNLKVSFENKYELEQKPVYIDRIWLVVQEAETPKSVAKNIVLKDKHRNNVAADIKLETDEEIGKYKARIKPKNKHVKEIIIDDLYVNDTLELKVDDISSTKGFVATYLIDPTQLNFTNATVTAIASGNELYKCKEWNFSTQQCDGQWQYIMSLVPGQEYSFILTHEDPVFGETGRRAVDPSLAPINETAFVAAWVDDAAKLSFRIIDTDGTIINTTIVDTTVDNQSRVSIAAINSTHFAIAWIDGPEDDVTFATYDFRGNNVVGEINVSTNVGTNTDVSVAEMGDRFVVCYMNDVLNDAQFQIFSNDGTSLVGETATDTTSNPEATLQNLVSCAGVNSTRFVYFWFDDASNDATFNVRSETGANIVAATDVDNNVGETAQVATAALGNDKFAMTFFHALDNDITIAVRTINNVVVLPVTDIDTNAGTQSRVAIAPINISNGGDGFVVAWEDQASADIKAAVFNNTGGQVTAPFTVDIAQDTTFRLIDVVAKDPITANSICSGKFIIAYSNTSNEAVFKRFSFDGTSWNGECDAIPPIPSNTKESPTDPATYVAGGFYQFNVTWTDNVAVANVLFEHNFTGALVNVSASGNISTEYFLNITDLPAGFYIWKSYANDTSGNANATTQQVYVVNRRTPTSSLLINGTEQNTTALITTALNITGALLDPANGFVMIFKNGTTIASGTSLASNISNYDEAGLFNITLAFNGTLNYTSQQKTLFVNVQPDVTPPFVITVTPTANKTNVSEPVLLKANVTDNTRISNVIASVLLPNSTMFNVTLVNTSFAIFEANFTVTDVIGNHTVTFIARDIFNNTNSTVITSFDVTTFMAIDVVDKNNRPVNLTVIVLANNSGLLDVMILPVVHNIQNLTIFAFNESEGTNDVFIENNTNDVS
ncbi:MAG: hypothetical protein QW331_00905, partial [Candidatus Woesearchaeota archaeon]